jgi:type IV secretory pathway VirB2 component (pilin)
MNPSNASLIDPPAESALVAGLKWVEATALGNAATAIAVVAVAAIGMLMLSGRLELRRGLTVVLGCFILFGASSIAAALTGFGGENAVPHRHSTSDGNPLSSRLQPPVGPSAAYDPYAGASVPNTR